MSARGPALRYGGGFRDDFFPEETASGAHLQKEREEYSSSEKGLGHFEVLPEEEIEAVIVWPDDTVEMNEDRVDAGGNAKQADGGQFRAKK